MEKCLNCGSEVTATGVLCASCAVPLRGADGLLPEHIWSLCDEPEGVCLVDGWGRPHGLARRTRIGRSDCTIMVLNGAVSRTHAEVRREDDGWQVSDLNSRNGTFLNGRPLIQAEPVKAGDRLSLAGVGFLFFPQMPDVGDVSLESVGTRPRSDGDEMFVQPACPFWTTCPQPDHALDAPCDHDVPLSLHASPRGGGGLLVISGRTLRLTTIQFAMVELLCERLLEDTDTSPLVGGFTPSVELVSRLPWDTRYPDDTHLKQLVRRLRSRLKPTVLRIESRHGLGYRLRLTRCDEANCKVQPTPSIARTGRHPAFLER